MIKEENALADVSPAELTPRQLEIERMKAKILAVRQPAVYLVAKPSSTPWSPPMARPSYAPTRVMSSRQGAEDFLLIKSRGT